MAEPPTLADLAVRAGGRVHGDPGVAIRDLTHDSRAAGPGTAFACRPGLSVDGHDFAAGAVAVGSPALVVERPLDVAAPQLEVPSVADALGPLAAAVHDNPSEQLRVLGVTGTNGKTTSAFLLESIFAAAGDATGLVGTIETRIKGQAIPGVRTTPEATDVQRLLRRMADEGVRSVAMEVSSHGLALGRVRGTRFSAVGFTNLSQDHLDFHEDLEAYFAAKAALFDGEYGDRGVVCVDDEHGQRLAAAAPIDVVRVSIGSGPDAPAADVRATELALGPEGARFTAHLLGGSAAASIKLPGTFNVANALLAMAMAEAAGVDLDAIVHGVAALAGVPGRMERVEAGQDFAVLVDYAHTPDSVAGALRSARAAAQGRVIGVLGCGGDRDRSKRPVMGRALAEEADIGLMTSDNPRSEDPAAILDEMAEGVREVPDARIDVLADRRAAIERAVELARPGDVVLILGKGHETGQEVHGDVSPFDDRDVALEALQRTRSTTEAAGHAGTPETPRPAGEARA